MAVIQKPDEHRFCIIVGAGISGIVQSCEFVRNKILALEEFEIIDRNGDYGGVWWQNTYPGAACDIPSHVYSISWAANPCKFERPAMLKCEAHAKSDWGRRFAPQAEIQKYYENIALDHGLDRSTTFNTEVVSATWDDALMLWVVETRNKKHGARKVWTCNLVRSTHLHSHFARLLNASSSSSVRLVNSAFRKSLIFLDSKLSKVNSGIQFHGLRMQI
jgi:cation diffusion facilitator CzcD-associated flavoprotein CzcO